MQSFDKWEIDFIGPINPPTWRTSERYIITMNKYLTRKVEVVIVKDCNMEMEACFIFENVVSRFRCPKILMSD